MQSEEIRRRFLTFFEKRGHAIIPSASLVTPDTSATENTLFNSAGMQPLVPYLLGEKHPAGTRLANVQKCVRTIDIDDIGDNTHATFFEMLGNWSLGDYFKKEAITWSYQFLISKEEGLGLDPSRLYVTVFEGDEVNNIPRDTESFEIWKSVGMLESNIYFKGVDSNWWPAVKGKDTWTGPTGPCTEMFYDITAEGLGEMTKGQYLEADEKQKVVEIWNDVFMEYRKQDGKIIEKLSQKNVDTGAGFERLTMVMQNTNNIFATDIFAPIMAKINEFTLSSDEKAKRIVADHVRTSVFMIADGVTPSNTDRGYILRRLLRRAVRFADQLGMKHDALSWIAQTVIEKYQNVYPNIHEKANEIKAEIDAEENKFRKTLEFSNTAEFIKEITKLAQIDNEEEIKTSGLNADKIFDFHQSKGIPIELIFEEINKVRVLNKLPVIDVGVEAYFKDLLEKKITAHQELSRKGAEQKFKGGLAGHSEKELQYHTATHLLNAALRQVLGAHVEQKGSNITPERLRFDFLHSAKMTDEEKKKVEEIVNKKIAEALPVTFQEIPIEKAHGLGAIGVFGDKYGEVVKVYTVGNEQTGIFSMELCGGPHVTNTSELKGTFKIQKEEAVSSGVRRIKAVLE